MQTGAEGKAGVGEIDADVRGTGVQRVQPLGQFFAEQPCVPF
jgi:hypothetical protein